MSRLDRTINITFVVLPFLGIIASGVLLWNSLLGPLDLVLFAFMYMITMTGITIGYHRLLTHRGFQTYAWMRGLLAALGTMALQGTPLDWVTDHRKHHTFTDEEGDPHSPHAGHEGGLRGTLRGLWHAHVGWLFEARAQSSIYRFARDLANDRPIRLVNKAFIPLVLLSLFLPSILALAITGGSWKAALTAFLWAGLARIFVAHHVTWSINSICHFFGTRRFDTDDHSTNVFWLALPSLGEAWHNNHHAFPQSAYHGLRWYELDPSGWAIALMERVGLAWDVVRITPERERSKLADPR
jgi:stearoyl-CoA desaturase (delta-9 desaturase)